MAASMAVKQPKVLMAPADKVKPRLQHLAKLLQVKGKATMPSCCTAPGLAKLLQVKGRDTMPSCCTALGRVPTAGLFEVCALG